MKRPFLVFVLMALAAPLLAQVATNSPRAQAYFHFAKARMLDEQGQWTQAIEEYKKALQYDPNNSMIYSEMAQTYASHRRIQEAADTAKKAIEVDANNVEAHRLLGQIYVQMLGVGDSQQPPSVEDIDNAIREFEEIVRIDPASRQEYLMLARLYQVKGDRSKATEIYKKFLGIEPGSEEGVTSLAKLHMDAGSTDEAVRLLEIFIAQQPDSDRALETLGEAYTSLEKFEKAADAYRRASKLDPENIEIQKALAQALFFSDRMEEAAKLYQSLLRAEPNDGLAMLRLGQIYRRQMRYDDSRQLLTRAVEAFPDSMEVQFNLVLLDRDQGLLVQALTRTSDILKKTERSNGRYTESEKQNRRIFVTHLGLLHTTMQNYDAAIQAYTELKTLTPEKDGRVDALIADTYRSAKNLDKAIAHTEQALSEAPESRQLRMLHADLIAEKGRIDEGIRELEKLFAGTDEDVAVLSAMANIHQRAKNFKEAQNIVNRAIRRFPNDEQVYFIQGSLHERQQRYGDAEKAFRKALEIENDNPAVLNYLGYMLADRGEKLEEALVMIQKAVDSDPVNGAYLDSLGWVYFRLNRLDLAEQYLKRALIFANDDPTLHDHMGDVYFKTKRYEEARVEWTKSVQLSEDSTESEKVKKKLDDLKKTRVAEK